MAPLISPAISILAVLALTVMLSVALTALFLWTWNTGDHDNNEAVADDATNIVRATFAALARDPGAKSASFRVVNGVVVHRDSTAGVPNGGDGPANGVRSEEVGSGSQDDSGTHGREMESWPELFHAGGKDSTSSNSRKGNAVVEGLGGFWVSVRSLEGP
ncbi:hypothetical protein HO173_009170 [Letharia columbiana]|uniref:Uncharacterized protein n=1 Tax=Letharia columbiana TaxID=112416 RepID=A0A8H6FPY9_9LECA|nr:uncharacterized protein HO173_009170 [Letharia columbiana]KAF6232504.1 hypothetical protein HO173_009170 [Letharia columbiana]